MSRKPLAEIARELEPERLVVASLYRREVREFLHDVRREFPHIEFIGAWGDIFVRDEFSLESRRRLLQSPVRRRMLYEDLFGDIEAVYRRSALVQLILRYKPDVIVDSINTATAIRTEDAYISNVRTGVVASLEEHPIRTYLARGIPVSVNTDDPRMFDTTLVEEFLQLLRRKPGEELLQLLH